MYTSARVGDIGPWPKSKALTPFDQKWQAAIKRFSFFGVSAKDNSKHGRCGGCPNCWSWRYYPQVSFYTNFSSLQFGARASSRKHLATGEVLIKPPWRGFFGIRLQWTRGDRKFPQVRGSKMSNWSQCESKARWKAPIKRRRGEKSEVKIEKGNAE
jgi:hypothetical protein